MSTGVELRFTAATTPSLSARPSPALRGQGQPLHVLVIDDTPEDRMLVRYVLGDLGYRVSEAATAESGIHSARMSSPDCIILDVRLPDFDGPEVLRQLKTEGELSCAVVMLTGTGRVEEAADCLNAGAMDFLSKHSLRDDMLDRAVRSAVERFHLRLENRQAQARNAQLAAIVTSTSDAIVSVNAETLTIESWNRGAERLFGYSEEEAVGRNLETLIVPEDRRDERNRIYRTVFNNRQSLNLETVRRRKDDTLVPVDKTTSPMFAPDGVISSLSVIYRDISDRKRMEEALRVSEEQFRAIVTTAHEGIWVLDRNGRTTFANSRIAEFLATVPEDLMGKALTEFCLQEDVDRAQDIIASSLAGEAQQFEFRLARRDGELIDVLAAASPLRAHDGEAIGIVAVFLDLSDQKRAESRQNMLMGELAHRSKNLLAVIQSLASRTLASPRSLDDARQAFIGRLQALARTHSNLTEEAFEGAPLDQVINSELGSFGSRARIRGPRIMLQAKIAQTFALVIHELATNASKYGALSARDGRLTVEWDIVGEGSDRRFVFDWRERGGPVPQPSTRRGFGSTLITTVAAADFRCTPEMALEPPGCRYHLDTKLSDIGAAIDESPVRRKLRSETMREFYDLWASLKGTEVAPSLKRFDASQYAWRDGVAIAEFARDGTMRFISVGRSLTERLGRPVKPSDIHGQEPTSMSEAYKRCARTAAPCHEHLRFNFSDDDAVTFERLLLPFSNNGRRVSHIVGLVVYSGRTNNQS